MQVHYLHIISNMEINTFQRTVKRFGNHTLIQSVSVSSLVCKDTEPEFLVSWMYMKIFETLLCHMQMRFRTAT